MLSFTKILTLIGAPVCDERHEQDAVVHHGTCRACLTPPPVILCIEVICRAKHRTSKTGGIFRKTTLLNTVSAIIAGVIDGTTAFCCLVAIKNAIQNMKCPAITNGTTKTGAVVGQGAIDNW